MRGRVAQVALWIDLNGRHSEAGLSNIAHFRAFSEGRSADQQSTAFGRSITLRPHHETLLLCGRIVGTEVGNPLVRLPASTPVCPSH